MVKFTQVVEKEFEDLSVTVEFFVNNNLKTVCNTYYTYTCPRCAGHGCRFTNDACMGGTIKGKLDLSKFQLPSEVSNQIKTKLLELANMLK
jgi:hypothetical protein